MLNFESIKKVFEQNTKENGDVVLDLETQNVLIRKFETEMRKLEFGQTYFCLNSSLKSRRKSDGSVVLTRNESSEILELLEYFLKKVNS